MSLDAMIDLPIAEKTMVLATDLDGTFLGGNADERRALYDWIEDNRQTVGLIFVTGRDPAFIGELCAARHVPVPEYVVGDVGTTIARFDAETGVDPIHELEEEIARIWDDAGPRVEEALAGAPGLTRQPTDFRYRVSYDLVPAEFNETAKATVAQMGFDWLISDNRYFDVLPKGVSKGPSLRRLLAHLGINQGNVLAAGDTLNDLSLLTCGVPAVAVGNAEEALTAALGDDPHIYRAKGHGCAGIAEAIESLSLHPTGALINVQ